MEDFDLEQINKRNIDAQWARYRVLESLKNMEVKRMEKPTPRQLEYIAALANETGQPVNAATIETAQQASQLIEELKAERNGRNGQLGNKAELRDRRVAFGMATKLVFKRYSDQQKDPKKWKRFWKDVEAFYREYQQHQEKAVQAVQ